MTSRELIYGSVTHYHTFLSSTVNQHATVSLVVLVSYSTTVAMKSWESLVNYLAGFRFSVRPSLSSVCSDSRVQETPTCYVSKYWRLTPPEQPIRGYEGARGLEGTICAYARRSVPSKRRGFQTVINIITQVLESFSKSACHRYYTYRCVSLHIITQNQPICSLDLKPDNLLFCDGTGRHSIWRLLNTSPPAAVGEFE